MKFSANEIDSQLQQLYLTSTSDLAPGLLNDSTLTAALAPIVRNIGASKQQDAYLKQLASFTQAKDEEIESICKAHYQEFVASTEQLLKVRQGTVSLKHKVAELNDDIQSKGGQVAAKKRLLLDNKRVAANIDETIDTLTACLRVLDLSTRISTLIQHRKYYSALRCLEELASDRIKTVSSVSSVFADRILATLPATRQSIKEASLKELTTWFLEARESSQAFGKRALKSMHIRSKRWYHRKLKDADGILRLGRVNSAVELVISERHAAEYDPFSDQSADGTEPVQIDFRPLHHCILIHDLLNCREELQISYAQDRRAQATLLLSSISLNPLTESSLEALLAELAGFFIIEAKVQQTASQDFRSWAAVQELWESTLEKTIASIAEGLRYCDDHELHLVAKLHCIEFSQTLAAQGYDLAPFDAFLSGLLEQFVNLLERKCSAELDTIIKEDEHISNMLVNDLEDFEKVASVSWLPPSGAWSEQELKDSAFPLVLPFSQTYPLCCIDIRNFVDQFYQFVENDPKRTVATDEVVRTALDRLLTEQMALKIRNQVHNMRNISQIALVAVNLLFFETACCELEVLLGTLRVNARQDQEPIPVPLTAVQSFRDTLEATTSHLITLITRKLDEFFDLSEYVWTPASAPPPNDVSGYLIDMTDYLTLVMDSTLAVLPAALKNSVYRGALQHTEERLMSCLTDAEPSRMNDNGLAVLAADVRYLSQHASGLPSPDAPPEERLGDVFEELSQMIAILQSDTLTEFLDPDIRELAFPRIDPRKLQFALIKLVTYYNSAQGVGIPPERKKEMESVLKTISRE